MCGYENKPEYREHRKQLKCNNHGINEVQNCKYLGSQIATNASVKEEITERI
jgi:hypothetical protein